MWEIVLSVVEDEDVLVDLDNEEVEQAPSASSELSIVLEDDLVSVEVVAEVLEDVTDEATGEVAEEMEELTVDLVDVVSQLELEPVLVLEAGDSLAVGVSVSVALKNVFCAGSLGRCTSPP